MGLVYALIAAGLSLIFGLMELVNFAHGEFLMVAMYVTFFAWSLAHLDPVVALPLAALALAGLGWAVYHGIIRWVLGGPMLAQVFATFGLAVLLRAGAQFVWGVDFRVVKDPWLAGRVSLGGVFVGLPQLAASALALAAFVALWWFLARTETGLALMATAQDRQAAALMGIDTQRMFALGWAIGSACVGVAGGLLAMFYYVFPEVGGVFALIAYVTVALGGFGNVPATLLAGVLVGLVEVFAGLLISPAMKYAVVFRLRGHYFAIATIAVGEIVQTLFINWDWAGGARGVFVPIRRPDSFVNFQFNESKAVYYYIALGLLLLGLAVTRRLEGSRPGYYFRAIREDQEAAASLGVHVAREKLRAMALSAALTALGGTFYAQYLLFIDPEAVFPLSLSILICLVAVLGGVGSLWGPLLGAAVLVPLSEGTRVLLGGTGKALDLLIYGALIMIIAVFQPAGMMGLVRQLGGRRAVAAGAGGRRESAA